MAPRRLHCDHQRAAIVARTHPTFGWRPQGPRFPWSLSNCLGCTGRERHTHTYHGTLVCVHMHEFDCICMDVFFSVVGWQSPLLSLSSCHSRHSRHSRHTPDKLIRNQLGSRCQSQQGRHFSQRIPGAVGPSSKTMAELQAAWQRRALGDPIWPSWIMIIILQNQPGMAQSLFFWTYPLRVAYT
jgi:hypothetical protein